VNDTAPVPRCHCPADQQWNPPYSAQPDERWKYWPFVGAQDNLR